MAKKYDCSRCPGYCCSYDHIEVSEHDVKRLARHLQLSIETVHNRYIKVSQGTAMLRHRKDHVYSSTCTFFDQTERRCTVYAGRPNVCRTYPYGNRCGYFSFIQFERAHQDDKDFIPLVSA